MDKFDEKVIGYDSIKETLRQIADVLKRPEAYKEKKGVHAKRTSDGVCPRTRKEPDGIDIDGRVWTKILRLSKDQRRKYISG